MKILKKKNFEIKDKRKQCEEISYYNYYVGMEHVEDSNLLNLLESVFTIFHAYI